MRKLSIKGKLYSIILIMFVPIILSHAIEIRSSLKRNIDLEIKLNQDFAEAVGVSFTNYLEKIWDTELSMGLAISNNDISSDKIGEYLQTVLGNQPTVRSYSWADPTTMKVIASSTKQAIGVSVAEREYIKKILNGEGKTVSDVIISRVFNEPTIIVARAIRKDGVLKGIVVGSINVDDLDAVLPPDRVAGSSFFGLIDKTGTIAYRNGVPDAAKKMINIKDDPNVATALKGKDVPVKKFLSPVTGENMIGINLAIDDINWVAYANTSYAEVLSRTFKDIRGELITMLFIAFAGLLFAIRLGREILQPIKALQASAMEMSKGNLAARTKITGTDEIGMAAQAFDQMAASIEEHDLYKTQFFSNISHELKTPLNIILASIQTIGSRHSGQFDCENYTYVAKYTAMMKQNCFRLLRLINNLIDITRIDSGFLKFSFGNYNIVSVVEDIVQSVADFSESKGIKITFDTEVEEKLIGCDPDKIERIILNLLSNSIKFTPSGGSIFVNVFQSEERVCIRVSDTGIGIPEDKLSIIFERFRQVDSSLHREYEGSGIGLSLVKALVEGHGGNISLKSEYGQGTEVTIELPAKIVQEDKTYMEKKAINHNIDKVQKINIEFSDIYK